MLWDHKYHFPCTTFSHKSEVTSVILLCYNYYYCVHQIIFYFHHSFRILFKRNIFTMWVVTLVTYIFQTKVNDYITFWDRIVNWSFSSNYNTSVQKIVLSTMLLNVTYIVFPLKNLYKYNADGKSNLQLHMNLYAVPRKALTVVIYIPGFWFIYSLPPEIFSIFLCLMISLKFLKLIQCSINIFLRGAGEEHAGCMLWIKTYK